MNMNRSQGSEGKLSFLASFEARKFMRFHASATRTASELFALELGGGRELADRIAQRRIASRKRFP